MTLLRRFHRQAFPLLLRGGLVLTLATGLFVAFAAFGGDTGASASSEPCTSSVHFNGMPSAWKVPPSCYSRVYRIPGSGPHYGFCNWWVGGPRPGPVGSVPRVGAVVHFAGGVQGASRDGHFGRVVAIYPGGHWILISEMNFIWRGAGFGRVDYRYVHTGPGVSFIYSR